MQIKARKQRHIVEVLANIELDGGVRVGGCEGVQQVLRQTARQLPSGVRRIRDCSDNRVSFKYTR